jgi:hypothetical protein
MAAIHFYLEASRGRPAGTQRGACEGERRREKEEKIKINSAPVHRAAVEAFLLIVSEKRCP